MLIEVGKRYVRRDGAITGPLVPSDHDNPEDQKNYPFSDSHRHLTYATNGQWALDVSETPFDLVEEYHGT